MACSRTKRQGRQGRQGRKSKVGSMHVRRVEHATHSSGSNTRRRAVAFFRSCVASRLERGAISCLRRVSAVLLEYRTWAFSRSSERRCVATLSLGGLGGLGVSFWNTPYRGATTVGRLPWRDCGPYAPNAAARSVSLTSAFFASCVRRVSVVSPFASVTCSENRSPFLP